MKNPSIQKQLLFALTSALLLVGKATAATESFTYNQNDTALSLNAPFTLSGFDPSLGTLTGVTLTMDLTTVASPVIYNVSGQPGSYSNATTKFTTTLSGPDNSTVSFETDSAVDAGSVSGSATSTTLTGSPVVSSTSTQVSAGNFAAYESANPVNFDLVAPAPPGLTSGGSPTSGSLLFGGTGSVAGTATVEYTFTPSEIPEPNASYLIMGGAGLLGLLRLRNNGV